MSIACLFSIDLAKHTTGELRSARDRAFRKMRDSIRLGMAIHAGAYAEAVAHITNELYIRGWLAPPATRKQVSRKAGV